MNGEQFEQMRVDIAEVRRALIGEKSIRQEGLISRVEKIEERLRTMDLRNAAITGGVTVAVFVGKYLLMGN
jgi:hypothetical protein